VGIAIPNFMFEFLQTDFPSHTTGTGPCQPSQGTHNCHATRSNRGRTGTGMADDGKTRVESPCGDVGTGAERGSVDLGDRRSSSCAGQDSQGRRGLRPGLRRMGARRRAHRVVHMETKVLPSFQSQPDCFGLDHAFGKRTMKRAPATLPALSRTFSAEIWPCSASTI
jgi:hypothetical protein